MNAHFPREKQPPRQFGALVHIVLFKHIHGAGKRCNENVGHIQYHTNISPTHEPAHRSSRCVT